MIGRGDVDGCSFSFNVRKASWRDEFDAQGNYVQSFREIEDVDLFDVGPVTFPAYTATSVDVRGDVGDMARSLWPAGIPRDVRRHLAISKTAGQVRPARLARGADSAEPGYCVCDCDECMDGDCATCSHVDCDCMDCLCDSAQGLRTAAAAALLMMRARARMLISAAIQSGR
jgi:hypothetical protein